MRNGYDDEDLGALLNVDVAELGIGTPYGVADGRPSINGDLFRIEAVAWTSENQMSPLYVGLSLILCPYM